MDNIKHAIQILKEAISYNTTTALCNERFLAERLGKILAAEGFDIKIVGCSKDSASLIASYGIDNGMKIALTGHIDVVDVTENWDSNPFEAIEKDGRIYGRGAADMKGGVAAMMAAAINVVRSSHEFNGKLVLNFVADEEATSRGTLSCLKEKELQGIDYAIIGEPTGLDICIAHLGTARFKITIKGKSAHSSKPSRGINAISKAAKVIQAIDKYHEELRKTKHEILGNPSACVTIVNGGSKDNIIPDSCELLMDRRMIIGETSQSVTEEIQSILDAIVENDGEFTYELKQYINLEACEVTKRDEITKICEKIYEDTFLEKAVVCEFGATCEQKLFADMGIPAIIIGPGNLAQAHIDNEYVEIGQIEQAVKYYENLIRELV